MKVVTIALLSILTAHVTSYCQNGEMKTFYSHYKIDSASKKNCDSVYNLIEQRRSAFSKEFKAYKEKYGSSQGFTYNWSENEKDILSSLKKSNPDYLRHLIYYSYFDLGYGVYGLRLNSEICEQSLKEVSPSSTV